MSKYQLLVFDWDGTLVDSIGRIVMAIRQAATQQGLPALDDRKIKGIIGLAIPEATLSLYPQLDGKPQQLLDFQRQYAEAYLALEAQPSSAYPGVAATLQRLHAQGYRMAVATGKTRRGLDRVMLAQPWSHCFEVTRCADETASKPNPQMLHEILEHCGVAPAQAVMVGDSIFDLQMATNAGMDAVGVTYGAQEAYVLRQQAPAAIIDQFEHLTDWLLADRVTL